MVKSCCRTDIEAIRQFLNRIRYHQIVKLIQGYAYYLDPWPRYDVASTMAVRFSNDLAHTVRLLLLGDAISSDVFRHFAGEEVYSSFLRTGLLLQDGDLLKTNGCCILSAADFYLVVSLPYFYPACVSPQGPVYIGADSFRLLNIVEKTVRGDVLDLCTGSGIQALALARSGNRVTGIELDSRAAAVARFNVILNCLEDRVEIREGDLYDPLSMDESFDLVVANPPFVAVPANVPYPLAGDGGPDGLRVVRSIIYGLASHLRVGGRAVLAFEALGGDEQPFFVEEVRRSFMSGWDIEIVLHHRQPIELQADGMADLALKLLGKGDRKVLRNEWADLYRDLNVSFLYAVTVDMNRVPGVHRLNVVDFCNPWRPDTEAEVPNNLEFVPLPPHYSVKVNGRELATIDAEAHDFLSHLRTKRTVAEAASAVYRGHRHKYGEYGQSKALAEALQLCLLLEGYGVIKRQVSQMASGSSAASFG